MNTLPLRQDQTVKHDPPNAFGDCFRTTVANLLGLSVEVVPHVLHDACEMDEANRRINAFLRQYGLAFVQMDMSEKFDKLIGLEGVWHEGSGDTERGTYHAAMFFDGKLEHDPHPSHAGFTKTSTIRGMFVSLRPFEVVQRAKLLTRLVTCADNGYDTDGTAKLCTLGRRDFLFVGRSKERDL